MVCFNFGSPKNLNSKIVFQNKGTNLKENDHGEEEIRKQSGFVFPIRILWFEKWQDLMLQIFSNRTNSKQEEIRIPCLPSLTI